MKRNQLLKHLEENDCILYREGGKHSIYQNLSSKKMTSVPRHPDIVENSAFDICKQLGIPKPKIN
jgi:predicted RNA binding protein YcfA (HicA-like mRNA interferase family)